MAIQTFPERLYPLSPTRREIDQKVAKGLYGWRQRVTGTCEDSVFPVDFRGGQFDQFQPEASGKFSGIHGTGGNSGTRLHHRERGIDSPDKEHVLRKERFCRWIL